MNKLEELLKELEIKKHEAETARNKASFDLKVIESQIKKVNRLLQDFK